MRVFRTEVVAVNYACAVVREACCETPLFFELRWIKAGLTQTSFVTPLSYTITIDATFLARSQSSFMDNFFVGVFTENFNFYFVLCVGLQPSHFQPLTAEFFFIDDRFDDFLFQFESEMFIGYTDDKRTNVVVLIDV